MTVFASPAFLPFLLSASRDLNSRVSLWLNSIRSISLLIFSWWKKGEANQVVCIHKSKSLILVRLLLWQICWDRELTDLNIPAQLPRLETQPQVIPWAPHRKDGSFCSLSPLSGILASSELSSEPWLCFIYLWGKLCSSAHRACPAPGDREKALTSLGPNTEHSTCPSVFLEQAWGCLHGVKNVCKPSSELLITWKYKNLISLQSRGALAYFHSTFCWQLLCLSCQCTFPSPSQCGCAVMGMFVLEHYLCRPEALHVPSTCARASSS